MEYILHILILASIYGIAALAINLISGYGGMITLSQGAFVGMGAYTTAILTTAMHLNFFVAMLLGVFLAMIVGLFLGIIFSKLNGDYFVLGTMGFAMLIYSLAENLESITRGTLGIPGIRPPSIFNFTFNTHELFFILVLVILCLVYWLFNSLSKSSFGRILSAIREDEHALQVFSYKTSYYKLITFVIASGVGAISGALFASYLTFINPGSFNLTISTFLLTTAIVGGIDSFEGTMLGVFVLVLIPEILRFAGFPSEIAAQMREAIYGILLVLFMLYRPKGLMGKYKL